MAELAAGLVGRRELGVEQARLQSPPVSQTHHFDCGNSGRSSLCEIQLGSKRTMVVERRHRIGPARTEKAGLIARPIHRARVLVRR